MTTSLITFGPARRLQLTWVRRRWLDLLAAVAVVAASALSGQRD